MNWNSVVVKLWGTIVLLILCILAPLAVSLDTIVTRFHYHRVTEELLDEASRYTRLLAAAEPAAGFDALASGAGADLALADIARLAQLAGTSFLVVDVFGRVLESSGVGDTVVGQAIAFPQLARALAGETSVSVGQGAAAGRDLFAAAVPILDGERVAGALLVLTPTTPVRQTLAAVRRVLLVVGLATLLLSAGLALLFSRRLAEPLLRMQRMARKLAAGDFSQRAPRPAGAGRHADEVALLADAINELAENLHRHERTRREFLANVSHELRTPLAYMRGYSQALLEDLVSDPAEQRAYLAILRDEAERVAGLVNDLFDLARLQDGRLKLDLAAIDLAALTERVTGRFEPGARRKGVTLGVEPDLRPLWVRADAPRLEQVLVNLLDNALRHTPAGGRITVRLGAAGDAARLTVADTGCGMPAEEVPLVWERFHKVDRARVRSGGSGLGLAIVRDLVAAHAGRVRLESEVGLGTTVDVELPLWTPAPAGASLDQDAAVR